jgi:hypothetical protein
VRKFIEECRIRSESFFYELHFARSRWPGKGIMG